MPDSDGFPIGISPVWATSIWHYGTDAEKQALDTYLQACWDAGYTHDEVIRGPVTSYPTPSERARIV